MNASEKKIQVISYSGYRGEETPRAIILKEQRIEVQKIVKMWVEKDLETGTIKRQFRFKGDDGRIHQIYYCETTKAWFCWVPD